MPTATHTWSGVQEEMHNYSLYTSFARMFAGALSEWELKNGQLTAVHCTMYTFSYVFTVYGSSHYWQQTLQTEYPLLHSIWFYMVWFYLVSRYDHFPNRNISLRRDLRRDNNTRYVGKMHENVDLQKNTLGQLIDKFYVQFFLFHIQCIKLVAKCSIFFKEVCTKIKKLYFLHILFNMHFSWIAYNSISHSRCWLFYNISYPYLSKLSEDKYRSTVYNTRHSHLWINESTEQCSEAKEANIFNGMT